jgi:hypothetical protein
MMLSESPMSGFRDLYDPEVLRAQGIDLYDRAITEGKPELLLTFIEEQLGYKPPRTNVLHDLAEHLQMRLMELREQYFEARDRVLYIVHNRFSVDLTPLLAPKPAIYHELPIDDLINSIVAQTPLRPEVESRLRRILKVSHAIAAQVYADMVLTDQLYSAIDDWLKALAAQNMRLPNDSRGSELLQ